MRLDRGISADISRSIQGKPRSLNELEADARRAAKQVAKKLAEFFAQQGWIEPQG